MKERESFMLYPTFSELIKLQIASSESILKNKYSYNSVSQGHYNSVFRGHGMEFDSVRPYVIGDDVRHIDWRVTARTLKPHVKTFQAECDRKIMIVVDSNNYMRFGTRGTFKSIQAAKATALISGIGFKNRDRVGGLVFGDIEDGIEFFNPSKQKHNIWELFKLLCKIEVINKPQISLDIALERLKSNLSTGTLVFLITDLEAITSTNIKMISEIKSRSDLILMPIIDPIDEHLPEINNIICKDGEQKEININYISKAMINKYSELWESKKEQLKNIVNKYNLKLINLYTNVAVYKSINEGLKRI